jgi:hypothetical protein
MRKNFSKPDEVREMPGGKGAGSIVHLGDMLVARGELRPGWRWSNDVRPIAGTLSCEYEHRGVVLEGTLHVEMDDGSGVDLSAGDAYLIPPAHDAWVVGDQVLRTIDWSIGNETYAKAKD